MNRTKSEKTAYVPTIPILSQTKSPLQELLIRLDIFSRHASLPGGPQQCHDLPDLERQPGLWCQTDGIFAHRDARKERPKVLDDKHGSSLPLQWPVVQPNLKLEHDLRGTYCPYLLKLATACEETRTGSSWQWSESFTQIESSSFPAVENNI